MPGGERLVIERYLDGNEREACKQEPDEHGSLDLNLRGLKRIPPCIAKHGDKVSFLWLVDNDIDKIENLDTFTRLEKLYMRGNRVRKIEGLDALTRLTWIDLSLNQIGNIENLDNQSRLEYLHLRENPGLPKNACAVFNKDRKEKRLPRVQCMQ